MTAVAGEVCPTLIVIPSAGGWTEADRDAVGANTRGKGGGGGDIREGRGYKAGEGRGGGRMI